MFFTISSLFIIFITIIISQFLIEPEAEIKNKVIIGKNSIISSDSKIIEPVIIGKNCKIGPNVTLGPYVSIGDDCVFQKCTCDNSIIMNNCKIDSQIDFSSSIIAEGSIIDDKNTSKNQFLLGERSNIKL